MNELDHQVLRALREMLAASKLTLDPHRAHEYRPATWQRWIGEDPTAMAVLEEHSTSEAKNGGRVSRADLVELSRQTDAADPQSLVRLFVATMLWGSGTRNGRAPRYTAAALGDPRLVPSLDATRRLVLDGDPGAAYLSFHSAGVGPPFYTKWFWACGLDRGLDPTPLILDARVWASLGALGWDSRRAAGSRRRHLRYVAYLESMERWAASGLPGIDTAEQLEQVLFRWAGGRR